MGLSQSRVSLGAFCLGGKGALLYWGSREGPNLENYPDCTLNRRIFHHNQAP